MLRIALFALLAGHMLMPPTASADPSRWSIAYPDTAPEGLVGNGRSVVRVRADGLDFHAGGDAHARFRVVIGDVVTDLATAPARATFFPGGVRYRVNVSGATIEVTHGALPEVPWLAIIRVDGAHAPVSIEVETSGLPAIAPVGRTSVPLSRGGGQVVLAAGAPAPMLTADALQRTLEAPYRTGLVIETPSPAIDRAVPFSRALLDLGFDGRMHVCEIFRWRDVWSRDLGSGLAVGAMASGRFVPAATTIGYDLARHAKADPLGLKVTEDPSQGGTAEGVAWLTRAVWRHYLLTGDRAFLGDAERTLRPWVDAWIARDADERGLIVDVSEWMDHSRFFLFPDGARVLYSNVLFADLLRRFARIERELATLDPAIAHAPGAADPKTRLANAGRYDAIATRFDRGINAGLWNEAKGMYDNCELWGLRDERWTSGENALAVLCDVAPESRARRALESVKQHLWRSAGSTTIYPPMTHVPEYIDHNFKVWPLVGAVEARARCAIGDADGAVWLLERCSATLDDVHYPGMMEELTSPEGRPEGGNAFLTAAGSYLDAIVTGLLGVDVVQPGCVRLRVDPRVPASWRDWRAEVPLPQGSLALVARGGRLEIRCTDPRVRAIEAPTSARVIGAEHAALVPRAWPKAVNDAAPTVTPIPAPRERRAAVFAMRGDFPGTGPAAPAGRRATDADLATLDPKEIGALIVPGNRLPRRAADGGDVAAALTRYLDAGGAIVFYGATMTDRGTMGEKSGVVEWYERRPTLQGAMLRDWLFRRSNDGPQVERAAERGTRDGWASGDLPTGADWSPIPVGVPWEKPLGVDYDGWGWYRARFTLPVEAKGHTVVLDLGRIDDRDWTYVNGVLVGEQSDWQSLRYYRLRPDDAAYAALRFGGDNVIAVQVLDLGGGGGLYADAPRAGYETPELSWAPIDPRSGEVAPRPTRHGVVSWGPGGRFFNSWETSRGAFGFAVEGHGAEFAGPLADLPATDAPVGEAFTDFAIHRPLRFEPLAFTRTQRRLLIPDRGERYPCAARIVNTETGGEFVLIPSSLVAAGSGPAILQRLGLRVLP